MSCSTACSLPHGSQPNPSDRQRRIFYIALRLPKTSYQDGYAKYAWRNKSPAGIHSRGAMIET
jgi:hypothetical protein